WLCSSGTCFDKRSPIFEDISYRVKLPGFFVSNAVLPPIGSKMVVHNGYPHVLVPKVAIIMAEKHNLVLVSEPIVGDGDMGRSASNIEKTVLALVECIVVYPNL
ncbi:Pectate lyase family protein, partial [Prunus dulcis]